MNEPNIAESHPIIFSLALLLLLIIIQGVGVGAAQQMGLPPSSFATYTEIVLAFILLALVTALRWWREIGLRPGEGQAGLLLYLPALALPLGNLTFGIVEDAWPVLLNYALLALLSGFVEEVAFRGLMLRAFRLAGPWKAVLATSFLFGLTHAANVLAGYEPVYALIQIAYALAIGFGFGAMALKGGRLWPLIAAHALGNFVAFINGGEIGPHLYLLSLFYILLFTGYGFYLLRNMRSEPAEVAAL